jgi:hypothetical protein
VTVIVDEGVRAQLILSSCAKESGVGSGGRLRPGVVAVAAWLEEGDESAGLAGLVGRSGQTRWAGHQMGFVQKKIIKKREQAARELWAELRFGPSR